MRISFFLQGPEIRTGFLKDAKPIQLKEGQEITISTDYEMKGDSNTITMSYKKLAEDLKPGNTILCADGTITLTVLSTDKAVGTVRCRCENTAVLSERKNVNLPRVSTVVLSEIPPLVLNNPLAPIEDSGVCINVVPPSTKLFFCYT